MEFETPQLDPKVIRRVVIIGGIILALALLSRAIGVKKMQADQVAVIVNNLSGDLRLHKKVGAIVYCPYFQDIYLLDKTRQTLEMTAEQGRGDRQGRDDVKIKTIDGSDVDVDITINYEIDPEKAIEIAMTSGPTDEYTYKWIRDYARSICRTEFGELTTEKFYDSELRRQKAGEALESLNKSLNAWGIIVTDVIPQDFSFYEEYQEKIKEKKLADQEIEEEKSKAKAAEENQKRVRIEETKRMEVEVARFDGEMQKQRIEAEAAAKKTMLEAEAYAIRIQAEAEAEFIRLQNEAKAVLATKKADAEGIKALADAFKGPGGMNLVRMEYAKRLKELKLTGTPVSIDNRMEKLELNEAGAAAGSRIRTKAPR
jgi:regulator of protease activity HflC (stomatin/prohibitin superfamily)